MQHIFEVCDLYLQQLRCCEVGDSSYALLKSFFATIELVQVQMNKWTS